MIFEKIGPLMNLKNLLPVAWSCSSISVPVISAGIKSGVNCMRLNFRFKTSARVLTSNVFARPGTPTKRQWPLQKRAISKLLAEIARTRAPDLRFLGQVQPPYQDACQLQ